MVNLRKKTQRTFLIFSAPSYMVGWNLPDRNMSLYLTAHFFDKNIKLRDWWITSLVFVENSSQPKDLFNHRIEEFTEMLGKPELKRKTEVKWKILDNRFNFFVKLYSDGIVYSTELISTIF